MIPYAPIRQHGVIGDRRTAALVAADGTVDWMCAPDYASEPLFAALLDAEKGGHFRFSPRTRRWGTQRYIDDTAVLQTQFLVEGGEVIATDAMILPDDTRVDAETSHRVIVRRLRAGGRRVPCSFDLRPFSSGGPLDVFCSHAPATPQTSFEFDLDPGEEAWAVVAHGGPKGWSSDRARLALEDTVQRWRRWTAGLRADGKRRTQIIRSLITIRLLGYAPSGALVAAPTTSLPERIGGTWNADYRFAWVRDSSLSLEALARHGDGQAAKQYLDWLVQLRPGKHAPLQVVYGVNGETNLKQRDQKELSGYRESAPVRFGNRAFEQKQLGIAGFLIDCVRAYREHGGQWDPRYFDLVTRMADYTARHWDEPDNGIWELTTQRHRVASRVMSWVALDRATSLARTLGHDERATSWQGAMQRIRDEVGSRGYDERRECFRQTFEGDAIDASALLIPVFRFLPGTDPRVNATIDRIADELTINGWVHRFDPCESDVDSSKAMGDFEGSFVPCTCWLATAYAEAGRVEEGEAVLAQIDHALGPLGLLPEGIDARTGEFLGNYPLLFSHAEYVRAAIELERARRDR